MTRDDIISALVNAEKDLYGGHPGKALLNTNDVIMVLFDRIEALEKRLDEPRRKAEAEANLLAELDKVDWGG